MKNVMSLFVLMIIVSCSSQEHVGANQAPNSREYQLGAYLWQQRSGEYRALTYQAYQWAKLLVERDLEDKHNRKRAVVFDIDETVLDNSFGGAREITEGLAWKESLFTDWAKLKQAVAIPGALEFIKFLDERQVEIFYISNRRQEVFNETYDNLVAQGFPVKKQNLLLQKEEKSKEPRRLEVLKNHEIILLVGDNLTDFAKIFDQKTDLERNKMVDQNSKMFGQKYIILPNPLYGDWENVLPKAKTKIELLKLTP